LLWRSCKAAHFCMMLPLSYKKESKEQPIGKSMRQEAMAIRKRLPHRLPRATKNGAPRRYASLRSRAQPFELISLSPEITSIECFQLVEFHRSKRPARKPAHVQSSSLNYIAIRGQPGSAHVQFSSTRKRCSTRGAREHCAEHCPSSCWSQF
jgi:hypothetical protein